MTLIDFFVLHQARTPVPGETGRLTLVGQSAGHPRRAMQRFLAWFGCWLVLQTALILAGVDAVVLIALLAVFLCFVPLIRRMVAEDRPSGAVGVSLTDHRVVVAQQLVGGDVRLLAELPPDRLRWARIERADGFWVPGGLVRVELGDREGPVVGLDLPKLSAVTTQLAIEEAGLELLPSTTVRPHRDPSGHLVDGLGQAEAGTDPTWVPRMAGIVLGLFFGLIALYAGVASAVEGMVGTATTALVIAVVLLAGATALIATRPQASARRAAEG